MKALVATDREAFYASEIEVRERAGYPPFGRLASLIISGGRPAPPPKALRASWRLSRRSTSGSRCLARPKHRSR